MPFLVTYDYNYCLKALQIENEVNFLDGEDYNVEQLY